MRRFHRAPLPFIQFREDEEKITTTGLALSEVKSNATEVEDLEVLEKLTRLEVGEDTQAEKPAQLCDEGQLLGVGVVRVTNSRPRQTIRQPSYLQDYLTNRIKHFWVGSDAMSQLNS